MSYDNTGRKINQMIKDNILIENTIEDVRTISLSKDAKRELELKYKIPSKINSINREKTKAKKNKFRQVKLAMTLEMINHLIPQYIDEYLSFEKKNLEEQELTIQSRKNKIEKIRNEIFLREQRSSNFKNCWFISLREIRSLDSAKLHNIPSTRVQGIFHTPTGDYSLYNHYKKRMKNYGNFEEVFIQSAEEFCDKPLDGAIHFASSYQVLLNTFLKTSDKQLNSYILTSLHYPKQFFVPLTYEGSRQLLIYTINDFNEKVSEALFLPDEISNARNSIFDAYSKKQKRVSYLGFECDFNQLDILYNNIATLYSDMEIEIYCFPHQAYFYEQLFKNYSNVKFKVIALENILKFFNIDKKGRLI